MTKFQTYRLKQTLDGPISFNNEQPFGRAQAMRPLSKLVDVGLMPEDNEVFSITDAGREAIK